MVEPVVIECLTGEMFPLGYRRTTFRYPSDKYLKLQTGDTVILASTVGGEALAKIMSIESVRVDDIAILEHVDGPYRNGLLVLRQLVKVYPQARLDTEFIRFELVVCAVVEG
jgi:hypothetical protein